MSIVDKIVDCKIVRLIPGDVLVVRISPDADLCGEACDELDEEIRRVFGDVAVLRVTSNVEVEVVRRDEQVDFDHCPSPKNGDRMS